LSHIVEIKTEIREEQAIRAACVRLQLAAPEHTTATSFKFEAKNSSSIRVRTTDTGDRRAFKVKAWNGSLYSAVTAQVTINLTPA